MLHTAELVERHRITIKMVDLPSTAAARTDVARLHALAYARRRGVELDERDMNAVSGSSTTRGSAFNGVVFDLHVGHGTIGTDETLGRWVWSAEAVEWWRDVFNSLARAGARLSLVDDEGGLSARGGRVTGLRSRLRFGAPGEATGTHADQRPPWMRRADGDDSEGE